MAFQSYDNETPADVKAAKASQIPLRLCSRLSKLMKTLQGLHLVTQNTPNGQKVQIFLEELAEVYGTKWTTTLLLVNQRIHLAELSP